MKIAAHHLNKRDGVLIGDVVGLGKTLMATAVARIFEEDHDLETLIICPTNLVKMWEDYREHYRLRGRVLPFSLVTKELPNLRRYRLVLIDESHNLRNRRRKTLPSHSGVHRQERQQVHAPVGDAVQQDLPRPGKPTLAFRAAKTSTSASGQRT